MKDITKLIRRFVGILLLSTILVIVLNIIILAVISANQTANGRPWTTAKETAEALQETETGYVLTGDLSDRLSRENAWAIYIDNDTLEVKWHTENLPETIPMQYTAFDIASLTRGYIDGYPTYTGESEDGLVVVGYPKDRYWKHMAPSWDYDFIKNAPYTVIVVIGVNIFLIFLIYMIANSKLLKSVKPITNGIQALPSGEPVYVKEKGLLSGLAAKINQTSDILQRQKRNLQRKETARANWISGVSHDIRTPLSMVMGYAGQIEDNESLPESERKKARIIRQQSMKMKNLINDLNLASKLEYNMQPINPKPVNLVAVARQSVVDFINLGMEEKYPIEWNTDEELTTCVINGDKELLRRAIGNLITNSQTHNPDGCTISVCARKSDTEYKIVVEDNGIGVTEEKLEKLRTTPHYMMSDSGTTEPRHGLGLLIVGQIVSAHKGTVFFDHGKQGGFAVTISFPIPPDDHI
jgi:signal transduction histidine kinase